MLTENCNLNCSMCIRGNQQGISLDVRELVKILEKNDFSEHDIVKLMCGKSKTVTVTSNGTYNNYLGELSTYENLFFQISLDGDKEKHNQIRGNRAFERTWETLIKMEELSIKYSVASVVSNKNRVEIFDLIPKLAGLSHMRYWRISYEMPFGSADFENMMTADEWNAFVKNISV